MENPNKQLFTYCPYCGEKALSSAGEKSFSCSFCRFKFFINTASACIALIFNEKNELLVTRRKRDPAKGMLDFPGGFADPGETIEQSLKREVREELNIDITGLKYFCSCPNRYVYKDVTYTVTDFAFTCRAESYDAIKACDDISDFYFFELSKIDKTLFGLDSPKIILDKLLNSLISANK